MFFVIDLIIRFILALVYLTGDIIAFIANLEDRFGGNHIHNRFGLND